jgi:chaperone modulatory protein CbpM
LDEACAEAGVEQGVVVGFIRREWIVCREGQPCPEPEIQLDAEDLARLRLILELQRDFGVNDEGVDIILRLLDQLHALRALAARKKAA